MIVLKLNTEFEKQIWKSFFLCLPTCICLFIISCSPRVFYASSYGSQSYLNLRLWFLVSVCALFVYHVDQQTNLFYSMLKIEIHSSSNLVFKFETSINYYLRKKSYGVISVWYILSNQFLAKMNYSKTRHDRIVFLNRALYFYIKKSEVLQEGWKKVHFCRPLLFALRQKTFFFSKIKKIFSIML